MTELTPKAAAFLAALQKLCIAHQIMVTPSDYDLLQIWDLTAGEEPVDVEGIEDRTEPPAQ